jgi:heme/copper-type cytochrome/quinol oxidase subunit 4
MKTFISYIAGFIFAIIIGLLPIFLTVVTDNAGWLLLYPLYLLLLGYLIFYPTGNDSW